MQKQIRVLIAEDDFLVSEMIQGVMKALGYTVVGHAADGRKAVELTRSLRPDVVLMDIKMPDLNGLEATKQILQDCPTPVVVLTAYESQDLAVESSAAGVGAYVVKPPHAAELERAIRISMARFKDIMELRELNLALKQRNAELQLDELTSLASRRVFEERFRVEWSRLSRSQSSLVLILADIDFFKAYNDHMGHVAGDTCLRRVSAALQDVARRSSDLLARYGGEEFAVLLPETSLEGGLQVASRMRAKVESLAIPHPDSAVSDFVTISLGIACAQPSHSSDPICLVEQADRALYQSKTLGRNQLMIAPVIPRDQASSCQAPGVACGPSQSY